MAVDEITSAAFLALNEGRGRSTRGAGGGRAAVWGESGFALSGVLSVGTTRGVAGISLLDDGDWEDDAEGCLSAVVAAGVRGGTEAEADIIA